MRTLGWLVLVVLLPSVEGQSLEPRLEARAVEDKALLAPETGIATHEIIVSMACPLRRDPSQPWELKFERVSTAPYASAIFAPPSHGFRFDDTKCADPAYRVERSSKLTVTTTREAPAFESFATKVRATLSQGELTNSTTVDATTTNDYFPLTQANPRELFLKVPPGRVASFQVEFINLGNGATRIDLQARNLGKGSMNVSVPAPFTLASRAGDPDAQHKTFQWVNATPPAAPGYSNAIYAFALTASSRAADQTATATDEVQINFSVQAQGAVAKAPPVAAPLWLLALAIAGRVRASVRRGA